MADFLSIRIKRGGTEYGPYTTDQAKTYLQLGDLLGTDLAWNESTSTWVPLATLLGSNPPPPPRARNLVLLILMGIVWSFVLFLTTFIGLCMVAGMIAGSMHPENARESGRQAGAAVGHYGTIPLLIGSLALCCWLTVKGKLPGTRK